LAELTALSSRNGTAIC